MRELQVNELQVIAGGTNNPIAQGLGHVAGITTAVCVAPFALVMAGFAMASPDTPADLVTGLYMATLGTAYTAGYGAGYVVGSVFDFTFSTAQQPAPLMH